MGEANAPGRPRRIRRGTPFPDSPRGRLPSGYWDFRRLPVMGIAAYRIEKADFTQAGQATNKFGGRIPMMLNGTVCHDVIFDRSRPFHTLSGEFSACSFRRIGTASGGLTGTFTDCDFTGANLSRAHLVANFVRCRFHEANLHVASWGSSFEDCEFGDARIHDLFEDIREYVESAPVVTFCVTNGLRKGETRHISYVP